MTTNSEEMRVHREYRLRISQNRSSVMPVGIAAPDSTNDVFASQLIRIKRMVQGRAEDRFGACTLVSPFSFTAPRR